MEVVDKSKHFFSFIIPVYNVEKYLVECVDSIISQNYFNYEIILIDDGSTDGSLDICNMLAFKHDCIKSYTQTNKGLSATRNKGIEYSQGIYLIFVDSDDKISEDKNILKKIHNILAYQDIELLLFSIRLFEVKNGAEVSIKNYKNNFTKCTGDLNLIFRKRLYLASACNKIIKKEIIDIYNIRFIEGYLSEDIYWCAELLMSTKKIFFYPLEFYFYRKNREGSITYVTSRKNIIDIFKQLVKYSHVLEKDIYIENKKYVNEYFAFYYLSCLFQMIKHIDFNLNEINKMMEKFSFYLSFSNEKRIVLVRVLYFILGFSGMISLIKILTLIRK